MKSLTPLAAMLAVLCSVAPAAAQAPALPRPPAHLDVAGQGSVERMPDQAVVTFSIVTNDDVASRATSANNATYNALVARLRALGITTPAIRTTSYGANYNPHPAQPNPQYPQRFGYVVTRIVAVTVDHTDGAGAIVDAGVAVGVTNVGGVSFTLKDQRGAYRDALAAAVADARAQADALAVAAHVRIVRIMAMSSASFAVPQPLPRFAQAVAVAPPPVPTDVQPSNLTVTASVSISYEIAP